MKISIVIAVYNVEDYLEECIDSVLKQSYKNTEIILVNDGSSDSSGDICASYSDNYTNIKYIDQTNGGISHARNVGIENSTGEYLIFLDSDDYWGKDFLNSLVGLIKEDREVDYIFFRFKYYYEVSGYFEEEKLDFNVDGLSKKPGILVLKEMLSSNLNIHWMVWKSIIRRDFLLENQLYFEVGRQYEDILWTPKVFLKAKKLDYYDDAPYIYRLEREGQVTSKFNYKILSDNLYAASYWNEELDKYSLDEDTKTLLMKSFVNRYHFAIWFSGFVSAEDRRQIIEELREDKELLKYKSSFISYITYALCNLIGFEATSNVFKHMITLKRKLRGGYGAATDL